jgi:hypothetical protein
MKLLDRFLYSKLWWIILRRITRGSEYEHAVPADYEEIRRDKGTEMSDTPRTDAAAVSSEYIRREMDYYAHKFVLADVAKELERELAETKRLLAEANERIKYYESITTGSEHKAIDAAIKEQQ